MSRYSLAFIVKRLNDEFTVEELLNSERKDSLSACAKFEMPPIYCMGQGLVSSWKKVFPMHEGNKLWSSMTETQRQLLLIFLLSLADA